jgi:peptide/nickel transport system permease protein
MDSSEERRNSSTFSRVAKYISFRATVLFVIISAGIFLAIVIVNYGGYIDNIHRADIDESLNFISLSMRGASSEELAQATESYRWAMEEAYGLHQPFLLRCVRWWYQTMTFNWGISYRIGVDRFLSSKAEAVTRIVLSRVPYTLLLAGSTNLILFFASIFVSLSLSKKNGSLLDRLTIALSPLSSIPNWVYGIILTVIFAGELRLLPFNGMYDTFPPTTKLGYIPIVLKHMILPVSAIFLGMFFSTVYTWRTFFLIHSGEDYLELATAKGLPTKIVERRYILRPTLPYIITSFAMLMITFWQGIIVLEVFFDWPGLGQLFMQSIVIKEMSVTIGIVTVFAFLLGITVFLLDIIYALVDPRVKIGGSGLTDKSVNLEKRSFQFRFSLNFSECLRSLWRSSAPSINSRVNLLIKQFSTQLVPGSQPRRVSPPKWTSQIGGRGGMVISGYCPHLKLENNRGQVLQAASQRCRCYVHGHPERIGNSFQSIVCRTAAYSTCPRWMPVSANPPTKKVKLVLPGRVGVLPKKAGGLYSAFRELLRYPMAVAGILIILALIGVSIYTMIAIPYKEAVALWGPETASKYHIPKVAMPVWVNWFRKDPLPPTIIQNSSIGAASKVFIPRASGALDETITYTIDYPYGGFPQDMLIIFNGQYEKKPFVSLTWRTPDGREFELGNFSVVSTQRYVVNQDLPQKYLAGQIIQKEDTLFSGSGGPAVIQILFKNPAVTDQNAPLKGTYTLKIDTTMFEDNANLDAEVILYGQVYGLAGSDDRRRDLMVALLWGTPVALTFGFLGAISTGLISMLIAAVGVWFGGWVDSAIQRLTEINMILPTLPIAITIYYLYSKSIWMILGVIIILSIFGSAIKTYRAAFIQVKELPYIEAAQAYGASNWRIIRHYLLPRIIPLLIPQLVILVPSYVFFEATLAYLNVSDPVLPTWGKVVYDALTRGTFTGHYYWVLEPVALMILTGLAFAVVGFALDSILNPRLRLI